MSYDIFFVRRDPGQSFEDALERTEESYERGDPGPLTEVELEQWERILPHARRILGEIEEFEGDTNRELSHPETGLQLSIFPGEISITVPYWHADDDAVAVMEKVYALARAVEDETGLEGYDPQLDEPVRDSRRPVATATLSDTSEQVDSGGFYSGATMDKADLNTEQESVRSSPRPRRWWEFWKS